MALIRAKSIPSILAYTDTDTQADTHTDTQADTQADTQMERV